MWDSSEMGRTLTLRAVAGSQLRRPSTRPTWPRSSFWPRRPAQTRSSRSRSRHSSSSRSRSSRHRPILCNSHPGSKRRSSLTCGCDTCPGAGSRRTCSRDSCSFGLLSSHRSRSFRLHSSFHRTHSFQSFPKLPSFWRARERLCSSGPWRLDVAAFRMSWRPPPQHGTWPRPRSGVMGG
jgi:hypothetical protein